MSNMREALEKALGSNPDAPAADLVKDGVERVTQVEFEHDKHVAKIVEHQEEWMRACNEWARIGEDYSRLSISFDDQEGKGIQIVRERARRLLPSMTEWEIDGIIHLLGRIEAGLRRYTPLPYEGISFGNIIEARNSGRPVNGLRVETFIEQFEDLLDLEPSGEGDLQQFLLAQRPKDSLGVGYTSTLSLFPPLSKWVQANAAKFS